MLVAGSAIPTTLRLSAATDGRLIALLTAPGDRTVLRDSVLRDFRQGQEQRAARLQSPMDVSRVLFPPREHLEPLRDPTFRDSILFWLPEERR